jgi:hypothetical protein
MSSKKEETKAAAGQPAATASEVPVAEVKAEPAQETQAPADTAERAAAAAEENAPTRVVVVLQVFRDKADHKTLFLPGAELEFDAQRANDVVSRGLAKYKE